MVGHSMGANVAGLYAGIMPERVAAFVNMEGFGLPEYAGIMPERVAAFVNMEGFGLPESDPENAPAHYRRWLEQSRDAEPYSTYRDFGELAKRIRKRSPRMSEERALFVASLWAEQADDGTVILRADPAHRLPNERACGPERDRHLCGGRIGGNPGCGPHGALRATGRTGRGPGGVSLLILQICVNISSTV
jgi:pimeloyl-ACP methyl ester carboxylesterase